MRLSSLRISNVLGIYDVSIDLSAAKMHFVFGDNASGKTSIIDALRFGLLGEPARVKLKKEYQLLVTDGEKHGFVKVDFSLTDNSVDSLYSYERSLPSERLVGWHKERRLSHSDRPIQAASRSVKIMPDLPRSLPYVIDASRFSSLTPVDRKRFLLGLSDTSIKLNDVREMMKRDGAREEFIEEVLPLFRLEDGFEKAAKYAKTKQSEARGAWRGLTLEVYGEKKAEGWRPVVERIDRRQIDGLKNVLEDQEKKIESTKEKLGLARVTNEALDCPVCHSQLTYARRQNQSGYELLLLGHPIAKEDRDIDGLQHQLENLIHTRGITRDQLTNLETKAKAEDDAKDVARLAGEHHQLAKDWGLVADMLGPNGIPGQIIDNILRPVNEQLTFAAAKTGWPVVFIERDMSITANGRPYALLSESEQWRADAHIAVAISSISNLGILILDRLDLLQKSLRPMALKWLFSLPYKTILVMGTMEDTKPGVQSTKNGGLIFHKLQDGLLA